MVDFADKCTRFDQLERCRSTYELVKKFELFDQQISQWCKFTRDKGSINDSRPVS